MRTPEDYINSAKQFNAIDSDAELCRRLGIHQSALIRIARGHTFASEETMLKLAELARVGLDEALLDLNRWRAKSDEARAVYVDLAKRLGYLPAIALAIVMTFAAPDASARTAAEQTISGNREFINCATFHCSFETYGPQPQPDAPLARSISVKWRRRIDVPETRKAQQPQATRWRKARSPKSYPASALPSATIPMVGWKSSMKG